MGFEDDVVLALVVVICEAGATVGADDEEDAAAAGDGVAGRSVFAVPMFGRSRGSGVQY